jgi:hypothetical protein
MERLDALAVRENNGKSYFTKIGAAFPNKDGKGYSILLDAIPAPVDGQFKIMLREPLPKDGAQRDQQHRANLGSGWVPPADNLDDDISF